MMFSDRVEIIAQFVVFIQKSEFGADIKISERFQIILVQIGLADQITLVDLLVIIEYETDLSVVDLIYFVF